MFQELEQTERTRVRLAADVESDPIYFRRRATEERIAAMRAKHLEARRSHIELATRYDELADAILKRNYDLGLDLFGMS